MCIHDIDQSLCVCVCNCITANAVVIHLCAGEPNFMINATRFTPGEHSLDVTITTMFGQELRVVPSIMFTIIG